MLGQSRRRCASIEATLRRSTNAGLILGQLLRRWAKINPALIQRLVFAGSLSQRQNNTQLTQGDVESMLVQCLSTIYDVGPTLSQL